MRRRGGIILSGKIPETRFQIAIELLKFGTIFPNVFDNAELCEVDVPYLNSSAIRYVEYDSASRRMHIRFTSGGQTYTFCGVPEHIYNGLINASSAGQFYHAHIEGRYQC